MSTVVGDAVALPQKVVDLLWCPGLALLKKCEELLELVRRELRGAAAREARAESVNTIFIPFCEPSITSNP